MAKDKEPKYVYPSHFGSHASMIDAEETAKLAAINKDDKQMELFPEKADMVALRDEHGLYMTERFRLDNGLADPNRYQTWRLEKLFARKEKEKA